MGPEFWKVLKDVFAGSPWALVIVLAVRQLIAAVPSLCQAYGDVSATWKRNQALRILLNPQSSSERRTAARQVLQYLDPRVGAAFSEPQPEPEPPESSTKQKPVRRWARIAPSARRSARR